MGRKTIKIDPAREDYESGALLGRDERFESDAEWHGRALDDIEFALSNTLPSIQANTDEVVKSLDMLSNRLWEISTILTSSVTNKAGPMAGWKFVFSWAMVLVIMLIVFKR